MFHYIDKPASSNTASSTTAEEWNRRINGFDVAGFARQVKASKAGHVIFTLGQNTGHYCSPNSVYDEIVGDSPSLLSRRDLIAEIAEALSPDVPLIAYLPSHPPANNASAVRALGCLPPWDASAWGLQKTWADDESADERLVVMQRNWQAVIAHWGERWGKSVAGWWIDGCYFSERLYRSVEEPNFSSFARALRAGNPDRLLAFNAGTGTPFARLAPEQDYTAGEFANRLPVPDKWTSIGASVEGMQTHLLGFLGNYWGAGEPRFPDLLMASYTNYLTARGAVLTWDVPIMENGVIAEAFIHQLASI